MGSHVTWDPLLIPPIKIHEFTFPYLKLLCQVSIYFNVLLMYSWSMFLFASWFVTFPHLLPSENFRITICIFNLKSLYYLYNNDLIWKSVKVREKQWLLATSSRKWSEKYDIDLGGGAAHLIFLCPNFFKILQCKLCFKHCLSDCAWFAWMILTEVTTHILAAQTFKQTSGT